MNQQPQIRTPGSAARVVLPRWLMALLVASILPLGSPAKAQPRFGAVAYHYLLLAHPLMSTFNPRTKRFDYTPSAPSSPNARAALQTRINDLQRRLAELETQLREAAKEPGRLNSASYVAFWRQRSLLQDQILLAQSTLAELETQGKFHDGVPSPETLMPICQLITRSTLKILEDLQKKYQFTAILNVTPFLHHHATSVSPLPLNHHWKAWWGHALMKSEIDQLRLAFRRFLLEKRPLQAMFPFKAGVVDLQAEAMRELATLYGPLFPPKAAPAPKATPPRSGNPSPGTSTP